MAYKPTSLLELGTWGRWMRAADRWMLRHLWVAAAVLILTALVSLMLHGM